MGRIRQWKWKRHILVLAAGWPAAMGLAQLCYRNWVCGWLLWLPVSGWISSILGRWKAKRQKQQTERDLMQLFRLIKANLARGLSLSNAIIRLEEAQLAEGEIKTGWRLLRRDTDLGRPIDACLRDFARHLSDDDQRFYCELLLLTHAQGGSLRLVLEDSLRLLEEKQETAGAIEVAIAGKKYEFRLMEIMPLGLLLYAELTNSDTYAAFLEDVLGAAVMTLLLLCYGFLVWLVERQLVIEV